MAASPLFLSFTASTAYSQSGICSATDTRKSFQDLRIGRMGQKSHCTATLISKNCAITAGHCAGIFSFVEFNTPPETINGVLQHSAPIDQYEGDITQSDHYEGTIGRDWAVFKIKENIISHRFPGEVYGYFDVGQLPPTIGDDVQLSGYGIDARDSKLHNFTLQTAAGKLMDIESPTGVSMLCHDIDSGGGDSGAAIIHKKDQRIIGIHTHGGCDLSIGKTNKGTLISHAPDFEAAIEKCLVSP